ncbi:MAG TPA: hypothetical protein VKV15_26025 [Bryobacteraceae bacterium]|nr:hypothetical protein [Bryobacteraceae bacterium]
MTRRDMSQPAPELTEHGKTPAATGSQEIPAPLLEWFTAQFQFALREMFKRRSAIWAFDFRGHNPQTGEWETYSLVLNILPQRQLAEIQREMAEHMKKLARGKN